MGRVGISLLMIYYCSPLSTIAKVVQTKDSSSIDAALTVVGARACMASFADIVTHIPVAANFLFV